MQNGTPPALLNEARRQLAALEREHARTERLIAALREQISAGHPAAHTPAASPPPAPKPRPSTEQRAVRTVAGLGTVITLIGVVLATIWAHQNDYLGTLGIALIGSVVSIGFAAAGVVAQRRRGPSPGVSALYGTSFLTAIAVLYFVAAAIYSLPSLAPIAAAHLMIWLAFVTLALFQHSGALVNVMLAAFIFYQIPLHLDDIASSLLAVAAPLALLGALAWRPQFGPATGALGAAAVAAAAAQSLLAGNADYQDFYAIVAVATNLAAIALLAVRPSSKEQSVARILALVIFPALAFILAQLTTETPALVWLPVGAAAAAAALALRRDPAGYWWLTLLPFGFAVATRLQQSYLAPLPLWAATLTAVVYVGLFFGIGWLVRRSGPGRHVAPIVVAWVLVFLFLEGVPVVPAPGPETAGVLSAAGVTALFFGACAYHRDIFLLLGQVGRFICGAALTLLTLTVIVWPVMALVAAFPGADNDLGFWVGQATASIVWILAASALLLLPRARRLGQSAAGLAAVVAVAAALKLVLFDLRASSDLTRIIVFLLCGAILLAVAVTRSRVAATPESPAGTGR